MSYLDPYQLLEIESYPPEGFEPMTLRRVQRKLMADFDLSQEAVIVRAGVELDKSTALQLLEELQDPVRAALHWELHQNKGFSAFLRFPISQHPEVIPQLVPGEFRNFVSPYLGKSINIFIKDALKKHNFSAASEAVERTRHLNFTDQEIAFQSSRKWLDQQLDNLSNWAESIETVNYLSPEVFTVLDKRAIFFLNYLPQRYQNWRNRYAIALLKFALPTINERKLGRQAFLAIEAASQLILDEAHENRINHVYQQLERHRNSPDRASKLQSPKKASLRSGCFMVWMILITIMVIAAFFTGLFRPSLEKPIRNNTHFGDFHDNSIIWNRRRILIDKIQSYQPTSSDTFSQDTSTLRQPYQDFIPGERIRPMILADHDSLIIDNQSGYHAVIFTCKRGDAVQYDHYFLSKGGLISEYPYAPGTIFQCYLGQKWDDLALPIVMAQDTYPTWFGAFHESYHIPKHKPSEDDPRFVIELPEKEDGEEEKLVRRITITRDSMIFSLENFPSP